MFTFFVRFWLASVSLGLICLALQHVYVTLRDGRKSRRHLEAHFYAQLVVMDRVHKGELDGKSTEDVREAYEFEKISYLSR